MSALIQSMRGFLASGFVVAPGAFDGLSARLVEQAGFPLVYASGGAISRAAGVPDLGLLSLSEVLDRVGQMTEVLSIPMIADIDTGFGHALNVTRTVKLFARLGVAAVHIEDQNFPKRCGHLAGKSLIAQAKMVEKVVAAKQAAEASGMVVIARTDAIAVSGFDDAIARANAYATAGADMIFVEAPQTVEQIEQIAQQVSAPLLINMFQGGQTPWVAPAQLADWGYRVMIVPSDLQRAAIAGMQATLTSIQQVGCGQSESMVSFSQREKIVGTDAYLAKTAT